MYKYTAILLAVATLITAQSLPTVPSCSLQCFTTALTTDGCASLTDFACHCAKPQLVSQIQPCVAQACSQAEQATVNSVVQQTCQQAGVTINLPGSGSSSSVPASSSAPASSSEAASASAPASSPAPAVSSAAASYGVGASSSAPASSSAGAGAPASSSSEGADSPTSYSTPELTSALASAVGSASTTTTSSGSGVAAATTSPTSANATSSITPFTGGAASSHMTDKFCGVAVVAAALAFAL